MGFLPKPGQREVFLCDLMKNRDLALELPHCRLDSVNAGIFFQAAL